MSAFEKRVALVEKWHTDLTKSLDDMYDLAEQVLDVWQEAEAHTEERIIKLLEDDLCGGGKPALSDDEYCEHDEQTLHLIALIKEASQKDNETVVLLTEGEK